MLKHLPNLLGGSFFVGAIACVVASAWPKAEAAEIAQGGGVRAVSALASDYVPRAPELLVEKMPTEALAVSAVQLAAERDGFMFRSVTCSRRMGSDYCSVCYEHPNEVSLRTLVRCDGDRCKWPLDDGEWDRIAYNPELACASREP